MLRLCYNPTEITLQFFITLKERDLNLSKKSPHKRKINLSRMKNRLAEIDFSFGAQNPAGFRKRAKKAVVPEYYKYF